MDHTLTRQIESFLKEEQHADAAIIEAAGLLLQLNRNRALYQNITRRPQRMATRLRYELQKWLEIRKDGHTLADIKEIDRRASKEEAAEVKTEIETGHARGGKRPDHADLPEEIQAIWEENAARWKKIKKAYATLATLEEPCDRYQWLKAMKEAWYKYKERFDEYDSYQAPTPKQQ